MMTLSRTRKARLMRVFHVRRLVMATLVATVAGALWNGIASLVHLFGVHLPSAWTLPLFIAVPTALHLARFWAAHRGWDAVSAQALPHLPSCLDGEVALDHVPEEGRWALPLPVQAALGRIARQKGWLAWSEVDAVLQAHHCPPRATWLGNGAGTERIARRGDVMALLAPQAALDVLLDGALPAASVQARGRF